VCWQKVALLVLSKGWLCVSRQNQMCHLCGWLKLNKKKCAVEKIKNTEGSTMCVGSVAVQLQYGQYVFGYLSKLAFHILFIVSSVCSLLCRLLGLLVTVAAMCSAGLQGCEPINRDENLLRELHCKTSENRIAYELLLGVVIYKLSLFSVIVPLKLFNIVIF
jgi:hypothetical protein